MRPPRVRGDREQIVSVDLTPSDIPSDWAETLVSAEAFRHEQQCLEHVWTFLGVTFDVAGDGDWFRASIGQRSVFVQRFGAELRGYENRCAHRFFPLRTTNRGNGPVKCAFHGWQYDRDGRAVGIPQCREVFGVIPQELGARLARVEIATCGTLVFGRFPPIGSGETLEEFLSEGFPILQAMSQAAKAPPRLEESIKANWKLCLHASLDDYHLVTVHPSTLGRGGPVAVQNVRYHRFGRHMAYFNSSTSQPFQEMATAIQENAFRPGDGGIYFGIFHACPNLFLVLFHVYKSYWYCGIVHYQALAHDRSAMCAWIYPAPFGRGGRGRLRWHGAVAYVRAALVRYVVRRIFREDHKICEALQTNAPGVDRAPRQSALELRIGWFEQSYRQMIAQGSERSAPPGRSRAG
jgi:phenylpropionate dioxygenase-like ring-hydroxylating dioxygenase large terminal subunit